MRQIVVDVETFYSRDYSLRKMTPVEYVLDPRFECIGWAVKDGDAPAVWMTPDEFRAFIASLPPKVCMISHNALFDMCVLAWRFGYVPHLMIDTLGMARAWVGHKVRSLALSNLARFYKVGEKGTTVHKVEGMSLEAIRAAGFYDEYAEYSKGDADICWAIYRKMVAEGFPANELPIMDAVLRCAVLPRFQLDANKLAEHYARVRADKEALLARIPYTREDLMSADKFAAALRMLGVEPPTKISPVTGKEAYAFAKTDQAFMDLEEHEDSNVQALVAARLGLRSTLEETRTERFMSIANLTWPGNRKALMPIPLRYSGAHTHRLSGEWSLNCMHPDVEVLTPEGWRRVGDWQPDTPVMQWWPTGELTWDTSPGKVSRSDTELVWFSAPFVRGGFTRDHRMVSMRGGRVVERTAGWVADHSGLDGIPVAGTYSGAASELTPDQVRLLVALQADGSRLWSPGPRSVGAPRRCTPTDGWQWGFHKARKADRLRNLLTSCGIRFTENASSGRFNFTVRASGRPAWLVKGFGVWCLSLSGQAMDAMLDELVHWDGFSNSRSGQPTYCTTDRGQAEWVQTIAHIRGRPATLRGYARPGGIIYNVYFRAGQLTSVGKGQTRVSPYRGDVHCPTVASSYVLARYDGGVFVTGNCQNLPRGGAIRDSIIAPKGCKVVAVDASQIEARVAGWFCGASDLVGAFAAKEDVYSSFATDVFGRPVNKKQNPVERFIGKTAVLGLQYGLGWAKFQKTVAMQSKAQVGQEVVLDDVEATRVVQTYRSKYHQIPTMWNRLNSLIPAMTGRCYEEVGPLTFLKGSIRLPSGLYLNYHDLENKDGQWRFTYAGTPKYLYGGKMLENITQALARIIVMDAAVRVRKELGRLFALQVHDELVFVVKEAQAESVMNYVIAEMCRPPAWGPTIPLDAEGGIGDTYGEVK